jgi:fatty-acyl-CoA synthase
VPYEDALATASPASDFEPRSSDDLYVLYTGGTTGVPKGVMWRSEDIFFAALGGGGFGQPPITTPEELAERIPAEDARYIAMVSAPLMHGGGQWMAFINFFAGGTVVPTAAATSTPTGSGALSSGSAATR